MTHERWARLAPLVDAVLDQPPERRLAYAAQISEGDAALGEELTRFINAYGEHENDKRYASIFEAAERARAALMSDRVIEPAVDLQAQLQQSLGTSYVVEHEIGGGGMARVFVADEVGLGRKVVIKVLPPGMSEAISAERFAREIKVAASLQQANIVPVLTAGTAAGFPYYTMPFVEGQSLRDRLGRDGAVPVGEAIGILRDVARALAFAHGRGVIHRDIKPGNILLSHRTAVVTDFGIAKALGQARGQARAVAMHESPSHTGTIGTPAYMAPEQASRDPNLDHRADIYSFGCVAYELLTGKRPFGGDAPHRVIAAHSFETPRSVTELRPEVPVAVAHLVASCLEKEPASRPQTADDVLLVLDSAMSQTVPDTARRSRRMTVAISAVVLILGAAGAAAYYWSRANEPFSVAAVPFRNISGDTALDYQSDGMSDEILTGLAKVGGLRIVERIAAMRYKDRTGLNPPEVRAVQRDLGARLLITGTVREADGRVIINIQLNDSVSRSEIWSANFTGGSKDLASTTDEIVQRITDTLRARFPRRIVPPPGAASTAGTTSGAAYDQYLQGSEQLRQRGSGIAQAIQSFQRAIDLDSNFARAHAALAAALALGPPFLDTSPRALLARSVSEARRALTLDSTLADAYAALGTAHAYAGEWEQAKSDMLHAVEHDPGNSSARQNYARHLVLRNHPAEAIEQFELARKDDPTSPLISAWLAYAFFLDGRRDSALAESERAAKLGPRLLGVANLGALVNLGLDRNEMARGFMTALNGPGMTNAPYVFAKLGDTAAANRLIGEWEARSPRPWFTDVAKATVLLAKGDSAGALAALKRSSDDSGAMWVFYIPLADPAYDLVRKSDRFGALVRQAHVDWGVVTNPRNLSVGR
jgi:eukaryotic-like serine/threonine-protein kinase